MAYPDFSNSSSSEFRKPQTWSSFTDSDELINSNLPLPANPGPAALLPLINVQPSPPHKTVLIISVMNLWMQASCYEFSLYIYSIRVLHVYASHPLLTCFIYLCAATPSPWHLFHPLRSLLLLVLPTRCLLSVIPSLFHAATTLSI